MLRILLVVAVLALSGSWSFAQSWTQAVTPTPAGMIITAGQWLWNLREPEYRIRIQAWGPDAESQRHTAFRMAVEQAVGTTVVSTTSTRNQRMESDTVAAHAAAFVTRYLVIEQNNQYQILDVWVKRTGMVSQHATTVSAQAQVAPSQSLQDHLARGDAIWQWILSSYPDQAYRVRIDRVQWRLDDQRAESLEVKFILDWNPAWLRTWQETAERTKTDLGKLDRVRQEVMLTRLIDTRPQVMLTVRDMHGHITWSGCKAYSELDHQQVQQWGQRFVSHAPGQVRLHASQILGHLSLRIPQGQVARYHSIELQVKSLDQCP